MSPPSDDRPPIGNGLLNESQQRNLAATCQYVDKLLSDLEHAFADADAASPFSRYVSDLVPAQQRLARDYFARIRAQLARALTAQGIPPVGRRIALRHAILTHLLYVDSAIEELTPRHMRGYGAVPPAAATAMEAFVEEVRTTINQLSRALATDQAGGLRQRLSSLQSEVDRSQLEVLESVIARYGLVEFRAALAVILDTLEHRGIELAIFGRVSSGKSSLLNRLLGRDVLPVGVTPITAIPTRIRFGHEPQLRVWFADASPRTLDLSLLHEYASERDNPANAKRVTRLIAELPAPLLTSGLTLVDTPGIGALATVGAAETRAYLPRCDVATVLIDAGSTVAPDDIRIVQALLDAGVPVSVLLSKADLLGAAERQEALDYTHESLTRECGVELLVAAVSVKPEYEQLFANWHERYVRPLIANIEAERQRTATRKIGVLRVQVRVALLALRKGADPGGDAGAVDVDTQLRSATAELAQTLQRVDEVTERLRGQWARIANATAADIDAGRPPVLALDDTFETVAADAARQVAAHLRRLIDVLDMAIAQLPDVAGRGPQAVLSRRSLLETPVPALPEGLAVPAMRRLERAAGHTLGRTLLARRIDDAVGEQVSVAIESYAAVLRRWAIERLEEIRREWTEHTDAVRSRLDRRLGHHAAPDVSLESLAEDLRRLA